MQIQQLKGGITAVKLPAKRSICVHSCSAQTSKDATSGTNWDARAWLLSLCTTSATALLTLGVQPSVALQAQGIQAGQAAVGLEGTMQELQRQHYTSPYALELNSMMCIADQLSLAAGEFLDITARAADDSYNAQLHGPGSILAPVLSRPVMFQENSSSNSVLLTSDISATSGGDGDQLQSLTPSSTAAMAVASQMSQQALTVASEALRLAALLETQGNDPSYVDLLQQIEEAAYSVSAVAADIAKPGVWLLDADEPTAAVGATAAQPTAAEQPALPHTIKV